MTDHQPRFAEVFAVVNATGAVIAAAALSQFESLRFGSFAQMLGGFLAADLVIYAAMKLGWLKRRKRADRS